MVQFIFEPFQMGCDWKCRTIVLNIGFVFASKCMLIGNTVLKINKNTSILFNMKMVNGFYEGQIQRRGGTICIKSMPIWNQCKQL